VLDLCGIWGKQQNSNDKWFFCLIGSQTAYQSNFSQILQTMMQITLCEALSKEAFKDYGDLGTLIKQEVYYHPLKPQRTDYGSFNPVVNVDGLSKSAY
jgi:hypothetical protein